MFGHTAVEAGGGADVLSLGTVTSSTVNLGDGANTLTTGDVAYGTLLAGAGSNTITLGHGGIQLRRGHARFLSCGRGWRQ